MGIVQCIYFAEFIWCRKYKSKSISKIKFIAWKLTSQCNLACHASAINFKKGLPERNKIDDGPLEETETERIVGGLQASPGQFPWTAALFFNDNYICASSIISPRTVLTVAHCVVIEGRLRDPDLFYAIANVNKSAPGVRIDFESINVHPDYNEQQLDNDVAVLTTLEPIPFSNEVRPVCISRPNTRVNEYLSFLKPWNNYAMGWGNTIPSRDVAVIPDILRYARQKIIPNFLCSLKNPYVNERKICATGIITGICNGDSGGPLVHMNKIDPPVAIGMASYVNNITVCGLGLPTVWTRLSRHYDFITQNAGDSSICFV